MINLASWLIGGVIFLAASWPVAHHAAPVVAVAVALGATATAIIGYLQSERVLRPVAVAALRGGLPENIRASGVIGRQMLAWALSTGVPLLAIVLAVVGDKAAYLHGPPEKLLNPILLLALLALGIGLASTLLVAMSIADPLRQLRWALGEVQRGNYNAHMQIYDASELGLLQAGFNDMVRDLSERQRLRDLFGRYVGEDVARRALERGTELGGQERDVAVLFVDLVGSTKLASTRPPAEVVSMLNEFFRVVVDTVGRHGGFVNKFQGDAALAIFGAPIEHPDASGGALAAARELHDELLPVIGSAEFGIGVSSGRAIAGHIGALARFEYTVIGDPVNEAARLTELAKLEDGHVLASAVAVSGALDAEALCWDVAEVVALRGRTAPTQLARPLNLAAPEEVISERSQRLAAVGRKREIAGQQRPDVDEGLALRVRGADRVVAQVQQVAEARHARRLTALEHSGVGLDDVLHHHRSFPAHPWSAAGQRSRGCSRRGFRASCWRAASRAPRRRAAAATTGRR